jgi:hypothetical protein
MSMERREERKKNKEREIEREEALCDGWQRGE